MHRDELENHLNQLLEISRFRDYCPNGLQVEGRDSVQHIVSGVTASMALIEAAIAAKADAVLVHHGYFWRGEDASITGMKARRIAALMTHNINLFAYHLPLDAHAELGNNTQLAARLGLVETARTGDQDLVVLGEPQQVMTLSELGAKISTALKRTPMIVGDGNKFIKKLAWCTGAAQSAFDTVSRMQVDVFITGEISEQTVHIARETGIAFIAAGHHATERYGVQALGEHLTQTFGVTHEFVDVDNPV